MKIRAITLHQPYASLIAIGAKRIETRHWPIDIKNEDGTPFDGPLVIHAAQTRASLSVIETEPLLRHVLEYAGLIEFDDKRKKLVSHTMPLGALVCVAGEVKCFKQEDLDDALLTPLEKACGGYGLGRYGWPLSGVTSLDEPIPHRGWQKWGSLDAEILRGRVGHLLQTCRQCDGTGLGECDPGYYFNPPAQDYCDSCVNGQEKVPCFDIYESLYPSWMHEPKAPVAAPRRALPTPGPQMSFADAFEDSLEENHELMSRLAKH